MLLISLMGFCLSISSASSEDGLPTLEEVMIRGRLQSSYRKTASVPEVTNQVPKANTAEFHATIEPLLQASCVPCHGPEKEEGGFRVDTLAPDLIRGGDADWWIEVINVLSKGEMPPEGDEFQLADDSRGQIIDWLSIELQTASQVHRNDRNHTSFRRMTRYEYNYALQDLLGLPYQFANDLSPETISEDGFENSSEMLQMSVKQFVNYRGIGRQALQKAIVRGPRPDNLYYSIPMDAALAKERNDKKPQDLKRGPRYRDLVTGETYRAAYQYNGGRMAHLPSKHLPETPVESSKVLLLPPGNEHRIDLSDQLPDRGTLRIRVLASRVSTEGPSPPTLRLRFGYQPSNDSRTSERVDDRDVPILTSPDQPAYYQWDVPLSEIPRNNYRGVTKLGDLPNPTEYLILQNSYSGRKNRQESEIEILSLQITTPAYEQWPPKSHASIFIDSNNKDDEPAYAREIFSAFLPRAWRRPVTEAEIDRQLALFTSVRPECQDFQEAVIEVLATALASPKFLYLVAESPQATKSEVLSDYELATRLSMFLWCSTPDAELLDLAERGKLNNHKTLIEQTKRMLADPRSDRFVQQFVRQWLGMQLLDYLDVEKASYPDFDDELKAAMQQEPIAFFQQMLTENRSVLDFVHADYAMVNERLAIHYGLQDVYGKPFRKVSLASNDRRGGLMTQAGLLAMNSDGKDSHPLKRGIWLLERLLNDPPPPPPAAVPEIDIADPEIAKMTVKERIENHRNDPACISCHAKIDPWGIAFENFDAVGLWRDQINDKPVDASSRLFNQQKLDGVDGLKRYLLANRQDQFCRSMVHKLTTFALGRPIGFADRSSIDQITAQLRQKGDGLSTLVSLIVTSELFQAK